VHGTTAGQWLDDVYPPGWRLVSLDVDSLASADQRHWFEAIGGTVAAVADPGEGLAEWFGRYGARHAVLRPDFIVFGTAADADGVSDLLDDLRRQLTGTDGLTHRTTDSTTDSITDDSKGSTP